LETDSCYGISLLSTANKILSTIPLLRLIPYAYKITGDHQCGFDAAGKLSSDIPHSLHTREK
jgi:hypothetical protein